MREFRWTLGVFGLFLTMSLGLLSQTGCSSSSSPAGPGGGSSVTIAWAWPEIYSNNGNVYAYLQLQANDTPVTDAVVVLSGSFAGAPVTASYDAPITHSGHVYADYTFSALTYTAAQTYILSSAVSGKTAAATVVAPGGLALSRSSVDGPVTLVTATHPGNDNAVIIDGSGGTTATLELTGISFPVTIDPPPSGAYPGTSGDVYDFTAVAETDSAVSVHNGGISYGDFSVDQELDESVTLP